MGAVLKRILHHDAAITPPSSDTGLGDWNDLSGLLLPETEELRLVDDIKNGTLDTVDAVTARLNEINEHYRDYQWAWTYNLILSYYHISEITAEDAAKIKQDYITARRTWIAEIRKDAEKEYKMGDVEPEVLENFLNKLDHEADFEN